MSDGGGLIVIWIAVTLSGGYYRKDGICITSGAATIGSLILTRIRVTVEHPRRDIPTGP